MTAINRILFFALISAVLFASAPARAEVNRVDVPVGESPALGPADAQVTIIEFLDYQ